MYRRGEHDFPYFIVTASRTRQENASDKMTSYAYPECQQGRHLLTIRRRGWALTNVHAESGGHQGARDERSAQLLYMSRMHERESGSEACILAGDFNARDGEDHCLRTEGWSDAQDLSPRGNHAHPPMWTWRRGDSQGKYDRV